jgi:murein hydrolase activator
MPRITLLLVFFLSFGCLYAQQGEKEDLQKKRQQLKKELEETQKALEQTQKLTKVNVGQWKLINQKIDKQGEVIDNIAGELKYIEGDMYTKQREINKLSRVLDTLKQEYAKSMVYAYKNRDNYEFLSFIFSAESFNDAIKRITYLKSYRNYRELQGENILHTQQLLGMKVKELSTKKQERNTVLEQKSIEMTQLERQEQEKQRIVQQLKEKQKELVAQIAAKRKQDAKLRSMIDAMIRKEIELARKKAEEERKARLAEEAKNKANNVTTPTKPVRVPKAGESVLVSSEADRVLDANFERNKGSLPWPADGFILNHFGRNEYPGGVVYNNPGVNIGTQVGASVKAVFDGEVTLVNRMEDKQVVFIKHGKYFTVYSNLETANVQKGQQVKTGQLVGKSAANDDGQGEVDFILMRENDNVNPEAWLRRK